jgi:hypothetical protein
MHALFMGFCETLLVLGVVDCEKREEEESERPPPPSTIHHHARTMTDRTTKILKGGATMAHACMASSLLIVVCVIGANLSFSIFVVVVVQTNCHSS